MPEPSTTPHSTIHVPAGIIDRFDLSSLFPRPQPLEVELGSGDGSFLVNYAARHPDANFLGVERLLGRLRKIDRKARRAGLANLRCVRIEALYLLQYLLPRHAAQAIHVYFPDPWPKRKHRRHRLIAASFTQAAAQALQPRGVVYLRTDDADYFAQMREVFAASPIFQETETPLDLAAFVTDFEKSFNEKGIATLRAAYARKDFQREEALRISSSVSDH